MTLTCQILSDCHFEFGSASQAIEFIEAEKTDADILILAGDITNLENRELTEAVFGKYSKTYRQVLYLPGNHEFYHWSIQEGIQYLSNLLENYPNITLLDNDNLFIFQNYVFLGGTLWFPKGIGDDKVRKFINDFRLIKDVELAYELNKETNKMLTTTIPIYQEKGMKVVVVTHHLPSYKLVNPDFFGDRLNRFFVSDEDEIIDELNPSYWIFGHDHRSQDTMLNSTRCISNQVGYSFNGEKSGYRSRFILELN